MSESQFNYKPNTTINPYRSAASLILNRLKWDLKPVSWSSRKSLKSLKDKYLGKRAVIICNGPSLRNVNFDELVGLDIYFFGLNKINLMFDETRFRPDCVVAINHLVIEQNLDFFNSTNIPLFLNSDKENLIKHRKNVAFLNFSQTPRKFAMDCSLSMFQGYTVTYAAMQLAFHMGFANVALIGCDHNFQSQGPSNKTVVSGEIDSNHFHPKYFADGVKWDLPDLLGSEHHYELADQMFKNYNRNIYNCTVGGKLEIFERMALNEFIDNV